MEITIKNTQPRLIVLGGEPSIKLSPGETGVLIEVWEEKKKNKAVQRLIEMGYIRACPEVQVARPLTEELSTVSLGDMIEQVRKCKVVDLLEKWNRTDNRKPVQQAAQLRILELQKAEKAKKAEHQDTAIPRVHDFSKAVEQAEAKPEPVVESTPEPVVEPETPDEPDSSGEPKKAGPGRPPGSPNKSKKKNKKKAKR